MDWFLYENGPRHEKADEKTSIFMNLFLLIIIAWKSENQIFR